MTQVSFYTLSSADQESRRQLACRLAEKALHLGHRVFIQVDSQEQARQLDTLLWHFKSTSFLPHSIAQSGQSRNESGMSESSATEKLIIGTADNQGQFEDVFINLSSSPCQRHERYQRINEILSADPEELEQGRQSYRFYQQHGFKPETHKL